MSPGWTDYRMRIPWIRYDVTELIEKDNAIVLVAGDGWAVGYMGNIMKRLNYFRKVCVCAKLTVWYEDGEKQEILTDQSWRTDTDEIVRTDNYMGEEINHTLSKDKKFYMPHYDYSEGNWIKTTTKNDWIFYSCLAEEVAPRIKVMHVLTPELIRGDERRVLYDMKQNMVGVIRLRVKGDRGTKICVRYAEMLEKDGTPYVENLRRSESTDVFILRGGETE